MPWALVRTFLPLNVVIFSVVPDAAEEAALGAELLAELVEPDEPDDELPHAARTKAAAANPAGAHHLPRIASLRSWLTASNTPDHVATTLSVHHKRQCFGRARSGRSRMAA
jgi:hypothetical protein